MKLIYIVKIKNHIYKYSFFEDKNQQCYLRMYIYMSLEGKNIKIIVKSASDSSEFSTLHLLGQIYIFFSSFS